MNLRPLHDYVIVRPAEEAHQTASGIVIPDSAREKPAQGDVVAVGNGRIPRSGSPVTPEVKPGDRVLFGKYSGNEIKLEGEALLVMHEADILALIEA
jgi:chaperonin GroES